MCAGYLLKLKNIKFLHSLLLLLCAQTSTSYSSIIGDVPRNTLYIFHIHSLLYTAAAVSYSSRAHKRALVFCSPLPHIYHHDIIPVAKANARQQRRGGRTARNVRIILLLNNYPINYGSYRVSNSFNYFRASIHR